MEVTHLSGVLVLMILPLIQATSPVAFSVGLTRTTTANTNDVIVYNAVYTNLGGGYDPNTGFFTCKTAGLYLFMFNALSENTKRFKLILHHNDKATVVGYGSADNMYTSGGNSIILKLQEGDVMNVKASGSSVLLGSGTEGFATFTGYMIAALEEKYTLPYDCGSK